MEQRNKRSKTHAELEAERMKALDRECAANNAFNKNVLRKLGRGPKRHSKPT